jgi:hypothetical protein
MQPDQDARLAETLPWLREPDDEPACPSVRSVSRAAATGEDAAALQPAHSGGRTGRLARLGDRLPRGKRAIAVLGAAGILAGGYAVTSSESLPQTSPAQTGPRATSEDDWAARAAVTLTSVDQQLDTIAQTEAAWNAKAADQPAGTPPTSVRALNDRKALL